MASETWRGCPCLYVEPCSPRCTCVNGGSSRGCSRCCTYGSLSQRKAMAVRLTAPDTETGRVQLATAVIEANREGDAELLRLNHEYTEGIIARMNDAETRVKELEKAYSEAERDRQQLQYALRQIAERHIGGWPAASYADAALASLPSPEARLDTALAALEGEKDG